jgi:hypothetical protein
MSGPLGVLAFGLGATLVTSGARFLTEGTGPDLHGVVKDGLRVWLTMVDAASAAKAVFEAFQAETRSELSRAQVVRDATPRKISIASS